MERFCSSPDLEFARVLDFSIANYFLLIDGWQASRSAGTAQNKEVRVFFVCAMTVACIVFWFEAGFCRDSYFDKVTGLQNSGGIVMLRAEFSCIGEQVGAILLRQSFGEGSQ